MTLYSIDNPLSDDGRNKLNNNFEHLNKSFNEAVETVSKKAFGQVVGEAKLDWKEPVASSNNLPGNAAKGETRMVRDTGKVYRYNGNAWVEIQQIDAGPVNEVDSRLTLQLAQKPSKGDLNYLNTNVNMNDSLTSWYRRSIWNQDPATSPSPSYHTRNVILAGDSHSWGEGSPNYQGLSAGGNVHVEWIHNDGFYGRLKRYIMDKWNSEPWRMIPELEFYNATVNVFQAANSESAKVRVNKPKFTKSLAVEKGDFRLVKVTKDISGYLLSAKTRADTYCVDNYRHNVEIGLFNEYFLEFKHTAGGTRVLAELETPTRFVVVNLLGGASQGRVKIELLDYTDHTDVVKTTFGSADYGMETPVIYRNMSNFSSKTVDTAHTINSGNIIIDCASFTGENNFIIDFKQKKCGIIRLSHDTGSTAIIDTRGVLAYNFDMVKNWAMGGHTTGALLGTEGNWNNSETRTHATDIVKYMAASAKLIVFQAPIVNEWLKQTPIETFKSNLTTLLKTASGLNFADSDLLVFNTLGTMNSEFGGIENPITNEMYNTALKEWCEANSVKFIDFRTHLKNMVNNTEGMLYGHLYINNGHPAPIVNEIIYKNLVDAIDQFI